MIKRNKQSQISVTVIFLFVFCGLLLIQCSSQSSKSGNDRDPLQIDRRKHLKTKMDLKTLGYAIQQLVLETGKAPEATSISELKNLGSPFFIRVRNYSDAWGNDFLYYRDEMDPAVFYIASPGKDGKFDGWDQEGSYKISLAEHYNRDLVYSNNGFIYISE